MTIRKLNEDTKAYIEILPEKILSGGIHYRYEPSKICDGLEK